MESQIEINPMHITNKIKSAFPEIGLKPRYSEIEAPFRR